MVLLKKDIQSKKLNKYILERELQLSQKMLMPWQRRSHNLLTLGCNQRAILHFLWKNGFDVTSIDTSIERIENLKAKVHGKIDVHLSALDYTSFNAKSFDYVFVMLSNEHENNFYSIIDEALRLAAKGILIHIYNPFSIMGYHKKFNPQNLPSILKNRLWFSGRKIHTLLRERFPNGEIKIGSSLFGSVQNWDSAMRCYTLNNMIMPLPLGCLLQIRLSKGLMRPLTGIPLRFNILPIPRPVEQLSRNSI